MIYRTFVVDKNKFNLGMSTFFKYSIRTLMKCYTVTNIFVDEENRTVYFKKTHKINGLKLKGSKEHTVKYEVIEIENSNNIQVKIFF